MADRGRAIPETNRGRPGIVADAAVAVVGAGPFGGPVAGVARGAPSVAAALAGVVDGRAAVRAPAPRRPGGAGRLVGLAAGDGTAAGRSADPVRVARRR